MNNWKLILMIGVYTKRIRVVFAGKRWFEQKYKKTLFYYLTLLHYELGQYQSFESWLLQSFKAEE